MNHEPLVSISDTSIYYGTNKILENINLTIFSDDFIGIIGPNGGGKTTLLKLILGILKPNSGTIQYHNNFSTSQIGYLPQRNDSDTQFPITVQDTILSGLMSQKKLVGWFNQKEKKEAQKLMEMMRIKQLKNKRISELSGGEYQKMMLCRAIISKPKLLILDEPNTYTDHNFETDICKILPELNKDLAIIMVSHDLGIISGVVKTIACVNKSLDYHEDNIISPDMMKIYGCPIDLITHGDVPHRVLGKH